MPVWILQLGTWTGKGRVACVLSPMSHPPGPGQAGPVCQPGGAGSQQLIPPQPHSSTASHRDIPVPGSSPGCHCHRASQSHQGKSLTTHPARARAQGTPVPGDLAAQLEWLESCPWGRIFHPPLPCRCPWSRVGHASIAPSLGHQPRGDEVARGLWESPALAMCSPPSHSSAQDRESSGCLAGLCDTDHPEHPLSGPPLPCRPQGGSTASPDSATMGEGLPVGDTLSLQCLLGITGALQVLL